MEISSSTWKRSAKAHRAWGKVLANTLTLSNATCKLALERAELAEALLKVERQEGITDNKLRIRAEALADKRLELLKRCGSALVSLDNAFPNEMDVIDADLLSELAEAIDASR